MTVLDNIMLGRHVRMKSGVLSRLSSTGAWRRRRRSRTASACEEMIDFLELQDLRKQPTSALAYGLRKRVELARALALEPKLLLLDEPMGGMNQEEKEDMARYILDVNEEWGTTIILIEHDMGVVMDISDHVAVLDRGRKIADGTPGRGAARPGGDPGLSRRRRARERRHERPGAHEAQRRRRCRSCCCATPSRRPDRPALREKDRGIWQTYTWRALLRRGARFRARAGGARASGAATSCR